MEFDAVVRRRVSSRSFSGKKASWKDVLNAIDLALQGPFAGNQNNFHFLIVEDKELIREISAACEQEWIADVGMLVVVCSDDSYLEEVYGERGRIYSRQQAGAVIQTLLLKFVDVGLNSCWVGAYDDEDIRRLLKIPKQVQIEAILPVGFLKGERIKKPSKKNLEHVLYWERWGDKRRPSLFEEDREEPPKVVEKK